MAKKAVPHGKVDILARAMLDVFQERMAHPRDAVKEDIESVRTPMGDMEDRLKEDTGRQ